MVFPYYDSLDKDKKEEFIFMEDRSKVYKGKLGSLSLRKGLEDLTTPLLFLTLI